MTTFTYDTAFHDYFESSDSPPPTLEERTRIPVIAEEAYAILSSQEHQMMPLGDFIAELRDYDVRSVVIDEILQYMIGNRWVALWKERGSDEAWISIIEEG